jgi:hypothetical protein
MNRNVLLLALSQALAMTVVSLMLSASALVSVGLSATPGWATLPLAMQYLATMLALHPLARLMARRGRRPVFVGARWSAPPGWRWRWPASPRQLRGVRAVGLCVGRARRGRAVLPLCGGRGRAGGAARAGVALTLAGGVLAAFSGPSSPGHPRSGRDALSASLRCWPGWPCWRPLAVAAAARAAAAGSGAGRRAACARSPARALPAGGGRRGRLRGDGPADDRHAAGHVVRRHDFGATTAVIQWHLVAMFAPGFVTGALIRRFGAWR